MESIQRHQQEILRNQDYLKKKPILGRIYQDFHQQISRHIPNERQGLVIEIGSGVADITRVIPDCLRTDLFQNPWIDQVENVYALTFPDRSARAVILFDVFHHLRFPGSALDEVLRILIPGGRLIIFDPAYSILGRLVYGMIHPEPLGLRQEITWQAPEGWNAEMSDYYAAQGNAQRIFYRGEGKLDPVNWQLRLVKRFASISYIASGGYSGPQLYPDFLYPLLHLLDRTCSLLPGIFATRLLVVLEKKHPDVE